MDIVPISSLYLSNSASVCHSQSCPSHPQQQLTPAAFDLARPNNIVLDLRPFSSYQQFRITNSFHVSVPSTLLKRKSFNLLNVIDGLDPYQLKILFSLLFEKKQSGGNVNNKQRQLRSTCSSGHLSGKEKPQSAADLDNTNANSNQNGNGNGNENGNGDENKTVNHSNTTGNDIETPANNNNNNNNTINVLFFNVGRNAENECDLLLQKFHNFAAANDPSSCIKLKPNLKFHMVNEAPPPQAPPKEAKIIDSKALKVGDVPERQLHNYSKDQIDDELVESISQEVANANGKKRSKSNSPPSGLPINDSFDLNLSSGIPVSGFSNSNPATNQIHKHNNNMAIPTLLKLSPNNHLKPNSMAMPLPKPNAKKKFQQLVAGMKTNATNTNNGSKNNFNSTSNGNGSVTITLSEKSPNLQQCLNSYISYEVMQERNKNIKVDDLPAWFQFYVSDRNANAIVNEEFSKLEKLQEKRLKIVYTTGAAATTTTTTTTTGINNILSNTISSQGLHSPSICSPSTPCPACDQVNYKIPFNYFKLDGASHSANGYIHGGGHSSPASLAGSSKWNGLGTGSTPGTPTTPTTPGTMCAKNRYSNILPFEHSRVKVNLRRFVEKSGGDCELASSRSKIDPQSKNSHASKSHICNKNRASDKHKDQATLEKENYINANFITVPQISPEVYIATQDPVKNNFCEFWSIVNHFEKLMLVVKLNSNVWNIDYYKQQQQQQRGIGEVENGDGYNAAQTKGGNPSTGRAGAIQSQQSQSKSARQGLENAAKPIKFHDMNIDFDNPGSLSLLREKLFQISDASKPSGRHLDPENSKKVCFKLLGNGGELVFGDNDGSNSNSSSKRTLPDYKRGSSSGSIGGNTTAPKYYQSQQFVKNGIILQNSNNEIIINNQFIIRCGHLVELEQIETRELDTIKQKLTNVYKSSGGSSSDDGEHSDAKADPAFEQMFAIKSSKFIIQIEFLNWPDFAIIKNLELILCLVKLKKFLISEVLLPINGAQINNSSDDGEMGSSNRKYQNDLNTIIHCSAGCGRTGTFIAIDMVLSSLEQHQKSSSTTTAANNTTDPYKSEKNLIYKTVSELRKQRLFMVQNINQYTMCYDATLQYFKQLHLKQMRRAKQQQVDRMAKGSAGVNVDNVEAGIEESGGKIVVAAVAAAKSKIDKMGKIEAAATEANEESGSPAEILGIYRPLGSDIQR